MNSVSGHRFRVWKSLENVCLTTWHTSKKVFLRKNANKDVWSGDLAGEHNVRLPKSVSGQRKGELETTAAWGRGRGKE